MKLHELQSSILNEGLIASLKTPAKHITVLANELKNIKLEIFNQKKRDSGEVIDSQFLNHAIIEFNHNSKFINAYFQAIDDAIIKTAIKTIIYKSGFVMPIGIISSATPPVFKRIITNKLLVILAHIMQSKNISDHKLLTELANDMHELFRATAYNKLLAALSKIARTMLKMLQTKSTTNSLTTESFIHKLDSYIIDEPLSESIISSLFNGGLDYAKGIALELSNATKAIKLQLHRDSEDTSKNPINDLEISEYNKEKAKLNEIYNAITIPAIKQGFSKMCEHGGYKLPVAGVSISRKAPPALKSRMVLKIILFVASIIAKINNISAKGPIEELAIAVVSAMSGIGIILNIILNAKTYQEVFTEITKAYGKVKKLSDAYNKHMSN